VNRYLADLARREFDVVVIGGGITGAWAAWDAVLRGLSVALIDRAGFGAATSANSLRIVHGGLRYLRHADLRRAQESLRERATLARVAPDLVRPLAFLVPAEGRGLRSAAALRLALRFHDMMRRRIDGTEEERIPSGRILPRGECLALFPEFAADRASAGALWYELQLDTEQFLLRLVLAAVRRGAAVADHVRADRLLLGGGRVRGVEATDVLSGETFAIRGRTVLSAVGPWTGRLAPQASPAMSWALGFNLVLDRPAAEVAVGLRPPSSASSDPAGGDRLFFLVPWQGKTVVGTAYRDHQQDPDRLRVTLGDQLDLLDRCNAACPALGLRLEEVTECQAGLLPLRRGGRNGLAERDLVIGPRRTRLGGFVVAAGVKYTTARRVAERAVDLIAGELGRRAPACTTASTPLVHASECAAAMHRPGMSGTRLRASSHTEGAVAHG
jgi:glycerol-3-phosphate dehydrogenase